MSPPGSPCRLVDSQFVITVATMITSGKVLKLLLEWLSSLIQSHEMEGEPLWN
jgi:hypothetical protein